MPPPGTEQGEHMHYIQACFYYQHTQRGGSYKTKDPNFEMLFWSYRLLRSRLFQYTQSSNHEEKAAGDLFLNSAKRIWAATVFQKIWKGKLVRSKMTMHVAGKITESTSHSADSSNMSNISFSNKKGHSTSLNTEETDTNDDIQQMDETKTTDDIHPVHETKTTNETQLVQMDETFPTNETKAVDDTNQINDIKQTHEAEPISGGILVQSENIPPKKGNLKPNFKDILIVGQIPGSLLKKYGSKPNLFSKLRDSGARVLTSFPSERMPNAKVPIHFTVVCDQNICDRHRSKPTKTIQKAAERGWNIVSFAFLDDLLSNKVSSILPYLLTPTIVKKFGIQKLASKPRHRHSGGPGSLLPYAELKRKKLQQDKLAQQKQKNKLKKPKQPCGAYIQFIRDNINKMNPSNMSKSYVERKKVLRQIWARMRNEEKDRYAKAARLNFELQKNKRMIDS